MQASLNVYKSIDTEHPPDGMYSLLNPIILKLLLSGPDSPDNPQMHEIPNNPLMFAQ